MIEKLRDVTQIKYFLKGTTIDLPFSLYYENKEYICSDILRILSTKRLVLKAKDVNLEQHVLIKLFASGKKGLRAFNNEKQGYQWINNAGVKTPELLLSAEDVAGCYMVVYDFIENAKDFSLVNGNNSILDIFTLLAKLHCNGLFQDDIHTGNILTANDELYLIDLGSVHCETEAVALSKKLSLLNLAKFIAQFTLIEQMDLVKNVEFYYRKREWVFNEGEYKRFLKMLFKVWRKRKSHYIKKCFRNCTMTCYGKNLTQEFAFKSDFMAEITNDFFKDIDQLMSRGDVIKAGNSATVTRVEINAKKVVIKRYNINGFWHFLRRCLRPSRAAVSWKNANLLELVGIKVPTALGFIECRWGFFRHKAYFISEYIEAEELMDVYNRREPYCNELEQINIIFLLLRKSQISHGDMKAKNLLLNNKGEILLIDLDSMQEHSNCRMFQKSHKKDKERFLRNWEDLKVKNVFLTLLAKV